MNVGYCTNIHSGTSLDEVIANLQEFALPVKQSVCPNEDMGIGLWMSADAAALAIRNGNTDRLQSWLQEHHLIPHTFNAFPYADFHQPVVKREVYRPDWTTVERAEYTKNVATLMSMLLPENAAGTISTLPLGWPGETSPNPSEFQGSKKQILDCVEAIRRLHEETGRHLRLCIEPEPGCLLQTSPQVVMFMNSYLFSDPATEEVHRKYLGVCHDVCHAAVMFEQQTDVLNRYKNAGISIGKVQISSALECQFGSDREDNIALLNELGQFSEDRYLHQTCIRTAEPPQHYFDDLFMAIRVQATEQHQGTCRTHYHVPIYLDAVGVLKTTQSEINKCLDWFVKNQYRSHFEVETYAWEVSPASVKGGSLVESIVSELRWLNERFPELETLNQVAQP